MKKFKALTFDVGGSVFDWKTSIETALGNCSFADAPALDRGAFAMAWRRQMFVRLGAVRRREATAYSMDDILELALQDVATEFPDFPMTDADAVRLLQAWHEMPVFPDFPPALERLKEHYKVVVLTVLSFAIVLDSSKANGMTWDGIISCQFLDHYKVDAEAYLEGCQALRLDPSEVCMVAVHPIDLICAKNAGLGTAMIEPQLGEPDIPGMVLPDAPAPEDYDYYAPDFATLVEKMCGKP
jgi:2-haloacid dehalogenase